MRLKATPSSLAPELVRTVTRFLAGLQALRTRIEYQKALRDFFTESRIATLEELLGTTSEIVVDYRNRLQARSLSPATVKLRLSAVSGLFALLVTEGRLAGNPADPRVVRRLTLSDVSPTEALTLEEVKAMIKTCNRKNVLGRRDRALIMTLFYEGLRRSEAAKLDYRDVTTRPGLLEIRDAKSSPYDVVRLHPQVLRAIEEYLKLLNEVLERRGPRPPDPVFVSLSSRSEAGGRLSPTAINEIVKDRARQAGIERRVSCHSLRHTCTTIALGQGAPLHQVQRHLRHRDIRTTLRYDRDRDVRKNPTLDVMPPLDG